MSKKQPTSTEPVEESNSIIRANAERVHVLAPEFASLYANDVQVQVSPWDVRLIFGQIQEIDSPDSTVTVKLIGELRMSPQLTKKVAMILVEQLEKYESRIGPIPIPAD